MRLVHIVIVGAALTLVCAVSLVWMPSQPLVSSPADGGTKAVRQTTPGQTLLVKQQSPSHGRQMMPLVAMDEAASEDDDELSPDDRLLSERIEQALTDDDFERTRLCVDEALASSSVEVRQAMVDALAWFGEPAIAELTKFIADTDEDVAESARNAWESAISDVEDDAVKISLVELTMQVVKDKEFQESIAGEYIGVDEKLAVESLLRIIESQGSPEGIAQAKATYEFVTGDEFVSREEAERWLREEYTPPEESDL